MPECRSRLSFKSGLVLCLCSLIFCLAACLTAFPPGSLPACAQPTDSQLTNSQPFSSQPADSQSADSQYEPQEQSSPYKKKWSFLKMTDDSEISIKKEMRRPFMFFRQALNQKWRPGFFFVFVFMMTVAFRYIAAEFLLASVKECRNNFFLSVAGALLFLVLTMTIAKVSFAVPELTPMGFFTMGLTELTFVLGLCTGLQAICQKIYELIALENKSRVQARLLELLTMAGVCALATALTLIGSIGRLPPLGNRLVALLAMVGIGGLVRAIYKKNR